MEQAAWKLTLELLSAVDSDADPRVAAMAHLGAGLILLQGCDPQTASRLLGAVEILVGAQGRGNEGWRDQ